MGFGRREFLGISAGLAAGLALSPAPWRLARDLTRQSQDPPWLASLPKGQLLEATTTSLACPGAPGITVLAAQGRPLIVRGNPEHPLSRGALSPAAQAEAYSLYHPRRVAGPLKRNATGALEPVSWAVALELLTERLKAAGGGVLAVGPAREGTLQNLLAEFMAGFGDGGGPGGYGRMPCEADTARAALALMGGTGQPGYDLDNASGLVLLGADAFDSMPASVHFRKTWGQKAQAFSCFFGPVRGASAALCQEWLPLASGRETHLALGLAWHLADLGRVAGDAAGIPDLREFLDLVRQRFGPAEVERETGLPPQALRLVAMQIAQGALAVPGSPAGQGAGLAPMVAGLALSVLAGRVNRPGGVYVTAGAGECAAARASAVGLPERFKEIALGLAQAPEVLLLMETDPAAGLPCTDLAVRAMKKAGFRAAFTSVLNASAQMCDLVLPAPMPLERWDDAETPYGLAFSTYGLARPLVRAGADARHPGDVLLDLSVRLRRPLKYSSFRQMLRERVALLEGLGGYVSGRVAPWQVLAGTPQPAPEADLWKVLSEGALWSRPEPVPTPVLSCGAAFLAKATAPAAIDLSLPCTLALQSSQRTGAPGMGVPLQSLTAIRKDEAREAMSVARMNASTARQVRVRQGDRVRLAGPSGRMEALVDLDESVMDGHVALLLGLGQHEGEPGGNAQRVTATTPEPLSGRATWAACRVSLERI
ncbi:molybdopterin-dependent oxidoreductase [Fundidesulfovibrio putealis]|uniref:molybdopterin-dependent oxidoreductase n=1 Tax=Fundidesulfovibrio putealis TaxID=270496 RepID=UPI0003FAFC39|nr:molybdopterin-dependent oxidoreductase [Fundidesulfovibrio putealis]